MENKRTAVLLIAHGSRRREANADLVKLQEVVSSRGEYAVVEIGYLELTEPTIPAGIARCVEHAADEILMMPYFLSAGAHVVDDLERHRKEAQEKYADVEIRICPPLGIDELMVELVLKRIRESAE